MTGGAGRPVVVTAVGCVTPLGGSATLSLSRLRAGEIARFDFDAWPDGGRDGWPSPVAFRAAVVSGAGAGVDTRPLPRTVRLAADATADALPDGLPTGLDRDRVAVVFGASKPDLAGLAEYGPLAWPSAAAAEIAKNLGTTGPCVAPAAACASGSAAVLRGAALIAEGACDAVLAGAADASVHPAVLAAFGRLGVLSRDRPGRPASPRPLDRDRDGFLVGEGAAALLLESSESAARRGATPLAEFLGGALLSGADDLVRVGRSSGALAETMRRGLADSGRRPEEVALVGLHATATVENDRLEAAAYREVFGEAGGPPVCAQKGAVGHLLGASSAFETVALIDALRTARVPPTAGHVSPDAGLVLPVAPGGVKLGDGVVLKLSAGFGGVFAATVWGPARRADAFKSGSASRTS